MSNITKPVDINKIWSQSGDILAPSDTKISQGWAVEIPARQHFNYIDNKQDQAIAHINQYGIAVWDAVTEYQFANVGGKSLVMGSNGTVYRSKQVSINQNPVTDLSNTYWEVAFTTIADLTQVATAAQARALTANNVFLSPLQLANAFTGATQTLGGNGSQPIPGGLIIKWGSSNVNTNADTRVTVTFPTPFPNNCFVVIPCHLGTLTNVNVIVDNTPPPSQTAFGWKSNYTGSQIHTWIAVGN